MKALHAVAFILVIVGGLNWLLVGAFDFNLVTYLVSFLGSFGSILEKIVYILVGLSAVYLVVTHKKDGMMDSPKM
jgi:uncharacterized membrane protein YuzA (DUF378 family)